MFTPSLISPSRVSKISLCSNLFESVECSKRWYDALDPSIDHSPWTPDEVCLFGLNADPTKAVGKFMSKDL